MKQGWLSRIAKHWKLFVQIASVQFYLILSIASRAQSLVPEPVFQDPQLLAGSAGYPAEGKNDAAYLFPNVGPGIDALITIQGKSSDRVNLDAIDLKGPEQDSVNGTGYDDAWQPVISYDNGYAKSHTRWWMEFKISFVKHGRPEQPADVNQFFVSGLDIDGDGKSLHEFVSFYGMQNYSLEAHSAVYAVDLNDFNKNPRFEGKRFDGPVKNYKGITVGATDVMVSGYYKQVSSIVVRLGAETGKLASHSASRKYSLWFRSLAMDVPVNRVWQTKMMVWNEPAPAGKNINAFKF